MSGAIMLSIMAIVLVCFVFVALAIFGVAAALNCENRGGPFVRHRPLDQTPGSSGAGSVRFLSMRYRLKILVVCKGGQAVAPGLQVWT